jgi:imidazolonepropionase-like amidohydrolase
VRGQFGRQRGDRPVTAEVWAEHSVWPQDPGFGRALVNGGVTTLQILPGSANLFGGRSVVVKNVYARTMQAMKFPGAPYGLKMACGENPKRVYGSRKGRDALDPDGQYRRRSRDLGTRGRV